MKTFIFGLMLALVQNVFATVSSELTPTQVLEQKGTLRVIDVRQIRQIRCQSPIKLKK